MAAFTSLKNILTKFLYFSCPHVSHISNSIFVLLLLWFNVIVFFSDEIDIVFRVSSLNVPLIYLYIIQVLPTPASPIKIILYNYFLFIHCVIFIY